MIDTGRILMLHIQDPARMKKLIRSRITKQFLTKDEEWTPDRQNAWPFETDEEALAVVNKLQLQNVELWYCFDDPEQAPQ